MDRYAEAIDVCRILEVSGFPTMLAGGCVRDRLLGLEPKDYDLATSATPAQVKALFKARGQRIVPVGEAHGTVCLVTRTQSLEITTLRQDIVCDGRHAQVKFSTQFPDDARRRDFTINALFEDRHGQIHDFVGGLEDLRRRQLRFVGEPRERIREDFLRILRYFRFLGQLGWEACDEQLAAIQAEREGLTRLSAERVLKEMQRILGYSGSFSWLGYMATSGVLVTLFPWYRERQTERVMQLLARAENEANLRWHAFFHLGGGPWAADALSQVMDRLRFSRVERRRQLLLEELFANAGFLWEGATALLKIRQHDRDLLPYLPAYLDLYAPLGLMLEPRLRVMLRSLMTTDDPEIPRAELMAQAPATRGWIIDLVRVHFHLRSGQLEVDVKEIVTHPEDYRIPNLTCSKVPGSAPENGTLENPSNG